MYLQTEAPESSPRRARRAALIIGGAAIVALALIGLVAVVVSSGEEPANVNTLESAQTVCDAGRNGTKLDGSTLLVDMRGSKDKAGVDLVTLECILEQLNVPEAVKQDMFSTRPSDGRQEGTWFGTSASWTYDPAKGLDLTVTRAP
ncbi:hypothetical protein Ais01nite_82880 [Asanoa ishikariensis]|uniref:Uncharacterized protein n=1 Tax=Asanoa ishikariensis TaxID=137265 RepID=A0A1H3SAH7_9ACTN|nr:hypothetical protein [Asanoa ishikariensis]GIF70253.1 hypothetical protein Ais01nite_82880 [Asanoa ishikariensis]SDZ34737.1 hypothetical protein SAMN05421684_4750 [Asanoa ishikariensis]